MARVNWALVSGITLGLIASGRAYAIDPIAWHSPLRPQLELSTHLTEQLDIRLGLNKLSPEYSARWTTDSLNGDPGLSASAFIDWQLPTGGLRITGGALYGDLGWSTLDEAWMTGFSNFRPNSTWESGFGASPTGPITPYLGLGWDNDFGDNDRLGLQLDLGLMFSGLPANSTAASMPTQTSIEQLRQETRLGETFESFRYSPMFSAGFRYRF